jgi:hypothetical protein
VENFEPSKFKIRPYGISPANHGKAKKEICHFPFEICLLSFEEKVAVPPTINIGRSGGFFGNGKCQMTNGKRKINSFDDFATY